MSDFVADPRRNEDTITIFERTRAGRRAFTAARDGRARGGGGGRAAGRARRDNPAQLPEVSEPEIVRHYTDALVEELPTSTTGFYPLGSCTMKHNPKLHERVAALPGHARLHPLQDPEHAQGALDLMWRLQRALSEIAGLPHVSLQPSAGSHGELAGLLLTRAYHEDRGERRTKVLTPDTAHGTNPATVTMAGYEVVKVGTAPDGGVDLDDLREKATDDVACLMLTNPNTLGLFDRNIEEIASIVHDAGATLYYDGANLNAVMGIAAARRHGLRHRPLQPAQDVHAAARRRRPRRGPDRGVRPDRALPAAAAGRARRAATTAPSRASSWTPTGRSRSASCAASRATSACFVRSYAYILLAGRRRPARGLGGRGAERQLPEGAAGRGGVAEYLPVAFDRICMHEFVLSGRGARDKLGVKTLDLAKRLLDHGVHPPTVYFPLLVEEALMIEPTETETKERLDHFADAVRSILEEAREDPEIARNAPYTTPVRRLDEAGAAKRPVVRQGMGENPGDPERAGRSDGESSGAL